MKAILPCPSGDPSLKRIDIWNLGPVPNCDYFEWPTKSMLDSMEPETKLDTVVIKLNDGWLSSVQISLTDGQESPTFEDARYNHTPPIRLEIFEHFRPIRSVTFSALR